MTRSWVCSAAKNARLPPQLARRLQWALAQYDVIAVEHFEPTIQHLKDRLGVFLVVRGDPDQLSADSERLDEPAAVEIHRQLRALRIRV